MTIFRSLGQVRLGSISIVLDEASPRLTNSSGRWWNHISGRLVSQFPHVSETSAFQTPFELLVGHLSPPPPPPSLTRHFVVVSESLMRGERGYVYIPCSGPGCMLNQPLREGKFQRLLLSDGRKANHCIIYEPLPPPPWTICQFRGPCFFVSIVGPRCHFSSLPFSEAGITAMFVSLRHR